MAGHRDLLEVDLLFSGTTSTYFELDGEDEPVPRDKNRNVTLTRRRRPRTSRRRSGS
jgi:hypothetical protein